MNKFKLEKHSDEKKGFNLQKGGEGKIGSSSTEKKPKTSSSKKWLWFLVSAIIVIVIGGILLIKPTTKTESESKTDASLNETTNNAGAREEVTSTSIMDKTEAQPTSTQQPQEQTSTSTPTPTTTTTQSTPIGSLTKEEIEKKAKEVIRGDYGNGVDRKNALGNNYEVIQKRVNELYKSGEIYY